MAARKPYQWNPRAGRYRDPNTGRFISRDDVRRALDRIIDASRDRVRKATEDLRRGEMNAGDWDALMRKEIKRTHLAGEALLRGGWKQLTPADFGRVGSAVRKQYKHLGGMIDDIRSGKQRTDGTLVNRATLYPASARVQFHEHQTDMLDELGYTEERNVLANAEHCNGCVDASALGWVKIGTLPPIGTRDCRGNDRCSMRYR